MPEQPHTLSICGKDFQASQDLKAPIISVIVPVFNDPEGIRKCLQSLSNQSLVRGKYEVIVVDNDSKPPLRDMVNQFPEAKYIQERIPGSYVARNSGYAISRGSIICFTDADCVPDTDWLKNSLKRFEDNPDLSAIGGKINLTLPENPSSAGLYEKLFAFRQSKYIHENGFSVTANLSTKREVLDEIGTFNPSMLSGGDCDWGHRLHMAGKKIVYAPEVIIEHPARASLSALIRKKRRVEGGRRSIPSLERYLPEWEPTPDRSQPRGVDMGLALLFTPSRLGLSHLDGLKVLAVTGVLTVVIWLERVRLLMGGTPLR